MYSTHMADKYGTVREPNKETNIMLFQFESIEEVLAFASRVSTVSTVHGEVRPGSINVAGLVDSLARISSQSGQYGPGGGKIQAIKVYRAVFNVGLREAKEAIEAHPTFAPTMTVSPEFYHGCGDEQCCPEEGEPF